MAKKPMPLENLPEYLKSSRDRRGMEAGEVPVVQMGQLMMPQKSYAWHMIAAAVMCLFLTVGSVVTYNAMSTDQFTVIVNVDNNVSTDAITKMVADGGGEALTVTQTEGGTYEVELKTRKDRKVFLEWLKELRGVREAQLEE